MNEFAKALLELSKECTTERVTASRCITAKPCWVLDVLISPNDANAYWDACLTNGELVTSYRLLQLIGRYGTTHFAFPHPIYFNNGLTVLIVENIGALTIQYLPD